MVEAFIIPSSRRTPPSITITSNAPDLPGMGSHRILNPAQFARQVSKFSIVNPEITLHLNLNGRGNGSNSNGKNKTNNKRSNSDSRTNVNGGNNNNGDGGSKNNKNSSDGRPHRDKNYYPYRDPSTASIDFKSGISSGTLVNPYQVSDSLNFSDLFVMNGSFFSRIKEQNYFRDLLSKDIFWFYRTKVSRKVNLNNLGQFTEEHFYKYISAISSGLQTYYMIESILAYTLKHPNSNKGMTHLRELLDAGIITQHERLRLKLLSCPIPKKLITFLCYMYSNFTFSKYPGAPIIRLGFRTMLSETCKDRAISYDYLNTIIEELEDYEVTTIMSLLNRSVDNLKVTELDHVSGDVIYDENFLNFWSNSCVTYYDPAIASDTISYTKTVSNIDQSVHYQQFTDEDIDGAFYALTSLLNDSTNTMEPGIWSPVNDFYSLVNCSVEQSSSLLCYCKDYGSLSNMTSSLTASQSGVLNSVYFNTYEKEYLRVDSLNPQAKKIQYHSLSNLSTSVASTILYILGTENN